MLVIIAALVRLEFVDPAVSLLAEIAEEGLECFAGGFGLSPSNTECVSVDPCDFWLSDFEIGRCSIRVGEVVQGG